MSKYKWLLDAGHGGLTHDGKYISSPDSMHVFKDGFTVYEGAINRSLVDELIKGLEYGRIEYEIIHDEFIDLPLTERVALANKYYAEDKRCIYLSVHSDAMPWGSRGKRTGFGVYTWQGHATRTRIDKTRSEKIADNFLTSYECFVQGLKFKPRKDFVEENSREDFYVLKETQCPAVLIQNLFYDNRKDAEYLLSEDGREKIGTALLYGILYSEEMESI